MNLHKLVLTSLAALALLAPAGLVPQAWAGDRPAVGHGHHAHYAVYYRHGHHHPWRLHGEYHSRHEAEHAADQLRHQGYEARVQLSH